MVARLLLSLLACSVFAQLPLLASSLELTFEERVRAQEAIERVYEKHRIGTRRPFEERVPRAALEKKVREYLSRSEALEHYWDDPVGERALLAEAERIVSQTRDPDRLLELFGALDDDPLLIQECLVRPALVDRLIHGFFLPEHCDANIRSDRSDGSRELRAEVGAGESRVDLLKLGPTLHQIGVELSGRDDTDPHPDSGFL